MYEEFYNKHYIATRPDSAIVDAWSDGPHPEKDTADAICIHKSGYQLSLNICYGFPEGYDSEFPLLRPIEENPPIYTEDGIPLYKWDAKVGVSGMIFPRCEEEIAVDRAAMTGVTL